MRDKNNWLKCGYPGMTWGVCRLSITDFEALVLLPCAGWLMRHAADLSSCHTSQHNWWWSRGQPLWYTADTLVVAYLWPMTAPTIKACNDLWVLLQQLSVRGSCNNEWVLLQLLSARGSCTNEWVLLQLLSARGNYNNGWVLLQQLSARGSLLNSPFYFINHLAGDNGIMCCHKCWHLGVDEEALGRCGGCAGVPWERARVWQGWGTVHTCVCMHKQCVSKFYRLPT